jgi:hypothetical protein
MGVQDVLREDAAAIDEDIDSLTVRIEATERQIVELRRKRDNARFHRAEVIAAAQALDGMGFRVERDEAGIVTVSIDHPTKEGTI